MWQQECWYFDQILFHFEIIIFETNDYDHEIMKRPSELGL